MDEDRRIEIARAYVDRTNNHDVASILELFADYGIYRSSLRGAFTGREEIRSMLALFFERHPDARWEVGDLQPGPADTIEFDFVMRATNPKSGEPFEQRGIERLAFTDRGTIRQVNVHYHHR